MNNKKIKFLKEKYDLHKDKGVHNTANRSNKLNGTKISTSDVNKSIGNFLDRYDDVLKNKETNPESFEALKKLILKEIIIKPEEIPDSYWKSQKQKIINRGEGNLLVNGEVSEIYKKNKIEEIILNQKSSLEKWINYLSDETCPYDISMKYYILRNISSMDSEFGKRCKGTVKNFPELNQEALALTMNLIEKSINGENIEGENEDLQKFSKNKNFAEIYKHFINNSKVSKNFLENIKGEWIKYDRGSDHMPLVKSLEGKSTEWCTDGEKTAKNQLSDGDFYVYYSEDQNGKNTHPRIAIRMNGEQIAEIKGILKGQEMDEYILPVLSEKLKEFGKEADEYREKEADMKFMTELTKKLDRGEEPTEEELIFLFELNKNIKNFGYGEDIRIVENKRKLKKSDLEKLFYIIESNSNYDNKYLNLNGLTSLPKGFKFPENIGGSLILNGLTSLPKGFKFPENIGGSLILRGLTSLPEGFEFPENIGGSLVLDRLISLPEGIKFPENIGGDLNLDGLTSLPEGIKFPENIGGDLNLNGLTSLPEGFKFPEKIGGYLILNGLTSLPKGIKFPENIRGSLILDGLTSLPEGIKFPENIRGSLYLNKLTSLPKGIKFPEKIGGDLYLNKLTSLSKGIKFPEKIGGDLYFSGGMKFLELLKIITKVEGELFQTEDNQLKNKPAKKNSNIFSKIGNFFKNLRQK